MCVDFNTALCSQACNGCCDYYYDENSFGFFVYITERSGIKILCKNVPTLQQS